MQGDESDATRHPGPDTAPGQVADSVAPARAPLPQQRTPAEQPAEQVAAPTSTPWTWAPPAPQPSAPQPSTPLRPATSAEPVAPWPPVGPFPPRMGNTGQQPIVRPRVGDTGQHPVVQPRTSAGHPPPQPMPGEPVRPTPGGAPQTGAFPAGPHLGVPSQAGPQMYPPQPGPQTYRPQPPYPGPPYPPQTYPGFGGYQPYPPPAPPRRSKITGLRAALLVALALVLVTPPAAIAFETVRRERTAAGTAQGVDPGGKAAGETGGRPGTSGTPKGSAPASVDGKVKQALADQGKALLSGDTAGFVAAVDPSAGALREELTRRFNSLRQLQVKVWEPTVLDAVEVAADNTADVIVYVKYCYVVTTCDPMNIESKTKWNVTGAGVKLLEFGVAEDLGPRPWERSELRVSVGKRVIMATTPKYASRLGTLLSAAEKAAELADRYAKWSPPPSRYVVYLAGPEEWSTWYGIKQESWVAGFALPLTADATEIVLNANRVDTKETLDVLRHEFTHVVTLATVQRAYDQTWWLVEGIAEYVRVQGLGGRFDDVASVRKYVQSGRWQNEIAMDDPPEGSTAADVSGRYGIAYLAVNRMAERFGEQKMLEFFDRTARQGDALQDAAMKVYGVSWDGVATDCVKYVRSHA
ncbi:basic secretory protein-like protein [Dactylosporangium sp. NPDC050688]|uniref:basic secretory protein-like protein n=1 Tax=Dactylosporangium sp. NPDC050688 TaxID=3157217 RepID=UPI0033EB1B3A